jgi:hypothetical protein
LLSNNELILLQSVIHAYHLSDLDVPLDLLARLDKLGLNYAVCKKMLGSSGIIGEYRGT